MKNEALRTAEKRSSEPKYIGGAAGKPSYDSPSQTWLCNELALRTRTVRSSVRLSTAMTVLSFLGIATMLVNAQLRDAGHYNFCSTADGAAKAAISVSTVALLCLLVYYHYLQLQMHMLTKKIGSIVLAAASERERLLLLAVELVVCSLHPFPSCFLSSDAHSSSNVASAPSDQDFLFDRSSNQSSPAMVDNTTSDYSYSEPVDADDSWLYKIKVFSVQYTDIEDLLGAAMFLRVYQLARSMFLHSKLFATILNYSLRALAHSRYNYALIFRSYIYVYEGYALLAIALGGLTTLVCALNLCESRALPLPDAAWVVLITFLTIGYGDRVPKTYCGRTISVAAGLFGSLCMGLAVSVLLRYMQPTYDELLTVSYVMDADLAKRDRQLAANAIGAAWLVHRDAVRGGSGVLQAFSNRCQLLRILKSRREIIQLRTANAEKNKPLSQLFNLRVQHRDMFHKLRGLHERQLATSRAIDQVKEEMLSRIDDNIDRLTKLVQ